MDSFGLRIGGEAGWGIATGADLIAKACIKLGYNVFSTKDYASQIKGGHNYHTIRVSQGSVNADVNQVDLLLALDKETLLRHQSAVSATGIVLYDARTIIEDKDSRYLSIPLAKIEASLKEKNIHNSVFAGAALKVMGISFEVLAELIKQEFSHKPALQDMLLKSARAGYDSVDAIKDKTLIQNKVITNPDFISGNDAITLGALKSKITFHAQYPMTPVSGILHNLAQEAIKNKELVVIQPEDEIAVINMALGASYAGARAMVATSGGGFSLMAESLGLAGMTEIPLVVIEGQRPGPATGLPTKTEQGDLKFVLFAGQGEFPRVVIAPATIEEGYTETKRAFYLAEKYQLPVIVLIDKHLAESYKTVDLIEEEKKFEFDYSKRINIITDIKDAQLNPDGMFKRYAGGNLYRTLPGTPNGIFTCAGDEHDEVGEITEDAETRIAMVQRRMNKLKLILSELPPPQLMGEKDAELMVVSWGGNQGAIVEAINLLKEEGKKVNFLSLRYLCPFQTVEIKSILSKSEKLLLIENNATGQLGELIAEKTGIIITDRLLRYDGNTFTVDEIYDELKKRI
ncbi:2-oxoacid:acceptor oxidoreductase subunit alpha [Candidatus Woesearchaeota archaeon]|nr:2-oxoacid:acceptor oxidoreductase subunit alpha [Candidatus Woesearchaeota archaeon]